MPAQNGQRKSSALCEAEAFDCGLTEKTGLRREITVSVCGL